MLTREDQERLNDSRLKLQTVSQTLDQMDPQKIPDYDEIQCCLESAERSLFEALNSASGTKIGK